MFDTRTRHISESASDLRRDAYNAAFHELGLTWYWDSETYGELAPRGAAERERIAGYLRSHQPHLLKAYEADFLIEAIEKAQSRCLESMQARGLNVASSIDWAEIQRGETGF
jgi:hypothetical protein